MFRNPMTLKDSDIGKHAMFTKGANTITGRITDIRRDVSRTKAIVTIDGMEVVINMTSILNVY